MYKTFIVLLTVFSLHASCQQVIDVSKNYTTVGPNNFYSVGGTLFINTKFVNLIEGSPYFVDAWLPGYVVGKNRTKYIVSHLKLDLQNGELHYKTPDATDYIATIPLQEIILTDSISGISYNFTASSLLPATAENNTGWYQKLTSGKVSLYKYYKKTLSEQKPYNASAVEQRIETDEQYFILYNHTLHRVKKPKDVSTILTDRKAEIEEWVKQKDDKNTSMDLRLVAVIDYYNGLDAK